MSHWIILPILLPAMIAPLIALTMRYDIVLARVFSFASVAGLLAFALILTGAAADGRIEHYALGDWVAPFGIVLVLDRLSALMLLLTALLAFMVLLYAVNGWDRRGRHFHSLFQFQLMGINGAFLTGDFFNLFVFFEVLLIASYGLMVHGGGEARVRAGVQYVAVNLVGSSLFLIAVGLIYSVTGTLNMADLAVKVAAAPADDVALLKTGALLLLLVFSIKAALVPVQFWLPATYAFAPGPVAALFAVLTKVGAYAIIRLYTLAFGDAAGGLAWMMAPWLMPAAAVTLALGMLGVLAARTMGQMASFAVIGSMGTLLLGVSLFNTTAMSASLYYLLHSTFAAAAMFLIVDLVAERRPGAGDAISVAPRFANVGLLAALFFLAAIGMSGMPPLSGFIGKLLILDGARGSAHVVAVWGLILMTSLLAIVGFARAGSTLFWKSTAQSGFLKGGRRAPIGLAAVAVGLPLLAMGLMTIFAGTLHVYLEATARQLFTPADYVEAVLGRTWGR